MIKQLLITLTLFGGLLMMSGSSMDDNGKAGRTNSPGENTCVNSCHDSYALNSGPGSVSIQNGGMTSNSYVPGTVYHMSVTVAQTGIGMFGVGIEALTSNGTNAGTLTITDAASTRIKNATVGGVTRINVTHAQNGGIASDSKVFQFDWTAPAAGTGNVTFFFSGVAANGNGNNNSDYVYNSSQVFTESCNAPAQPGSINGDAMLCEGSGSVYSISPVTGATSYTWTLPNGWTGTSTTETINVVSSYNSGDVTVTANNSCGSSAVSNLSVTVNPLPSGQITLAPGNPDTLQASPASSYQWYVDGNLISGAVYDYYIPTQVGNYTVEITDGNSCTGVTQAFAYTTLGIKNISNSVLSVFPNPASDFISVSSSVPFNQEEVKMFDAAGHIVLQSALNGQDAKIDISKLSEGIYYLTTGSGNEKYYSKILVKR